MSGSLIIVPCTWIDWSSEKILPSSSTGGAGPQDQYGLSLRAYVIYGPRVSAPSMEVPLVRPTLHRQILEASIPIVHPASSTFSTALITIGESSQQLVEHGQQDKSLQEQSGKSAS